MVIWCNIGLGRVVGLVEKLKGWVEVIEVGRLFFGCGWGGFGCGGW